MSPTSAKPPLVAYHRESAPGHVQGLKEKTLSELATTCRNIGYTQLQLASFLGVSQPRISDAMRGKHERFTLDCLFGMLFSLGKEVTIKIQDFPSASGASVKSRSETENRELLAHYTAIIEEDPGDSASFGRRAWAYAQLGEWERALIDWSRAAELEPDRPGPRSNRIMAYRKLGQLSTALYECDRYEQDFPGENADSHRGMILCDLGRYEEALRFYTEDVADRSDRPGPYHNRGLLYEKMGRYQEALEDFETARRIDPSNSFYQQKVEQLKAETT